MNVYELSASLTLDTNEYNKQLQGAGQKTSMFGDMLKANLATDAIKMGLHAVAGACQTVVQGIGNIVKSSVEATAQFEQLSGGVETLFKDAGDSVMANARNAFKTAGMSANEYMETVTSFSASLIASLDGDTAKASEKADQAIQQMSDNANKMGSTMESIQNAYQGFAKQNYTMLDNLKLGYGGTKEEMQRLLTDAEKLSGQKFDISSYADIVDAIKVIQDEMDITGTTSKEASTTIEGSLNSMKSAWENVVMGISNGDGNLDTYISNLVDSVTTFASNIIPVVEKAIGGLGDLISKLAPTIASAIPSLLSNVLPSLIDSITNLISSVGKALPDLFKGLWGALSDAVLSLLEQLPDMIEPLLDGVSETLPIVMEAMTNLLNKLAEMLPDILPDFIEQLITFIADYTKTLAENAPALIQSAIQIIIALAQGLVQALPVLIEYLPQIIASLVIAMVALAPELVKAGLELIKALGQGLISGIGTLGEKAVEIVEKIKEKFTEKVDKFKEIGKNIVNGIKDGFVEAFEKFKAKVDQLVGKLIDGVKGILGIHSPSKVFAQIGGFMAEGMGEGWGSEFKDVQKTINKNLDFSAKAISTSPIGFNGLGTGAIYNQTININDQIATADELAQKIRIESRYGLMRGVALG